MKYMILAALIFLGACVGQGGIPGFNIQMSADPPSVFVSRPVNINIDIENNDLDEEGRIRSVTYMKAEIFNTGILEGTCNTKEEVFFRGFTTYNCLLIAPNKIIGDRETTDVHARVQIKNTLSAAQVIEMVSEQYYESKRQEIQLGPGSYRYADRNLEMQIDFSDQLPIIVRPEKKTFMYITIRNIGSGFITEIKKENFRLDQNGNVVSCNFQDVTIDNDAFQKIACELNMPQSTPLLSNYLASLEINYDYEYRAKTTVEIIK